MSVAVVRSLGSGRQLRTPQELEDFEQEWVDQYLLAAVGASRYTTGLTGARQ